MGLHLGFNGVSPCEHRLDVMVDIYAEVGEQAARGAVPPVGADGERDAGIAQALDRGDDRREGLDPLGLDLEVVGDEPLDQGPQGSVVGPLCPLRVERREKEALGALAGALAESSRTRPARGPSPSIAG